MTDLKDTSKMSFEEIIDYAKDLEFEGKFQQVIDVLMPLFDTNMHLHRATAHNMVGLAMRMLRRFEEAANHYLSALVDAQTDHNKALAHINLADLKRVAKSDYISAHMSLDEALTYAENGSLMHAKAVDQRGLVFVGQKDLESAIPYYGCAADISREIYSKTSNQSDAYRDVVKVYANALSHYADACILLPEQMENARASVVEANKRQAEALKLHSEINNNASIANSVAGLCRLMLMMLKLNPLIDTSQLESIEPYYLQAEAALSGSDFTRGKAALHLNFADLYMNYFIPEKAAPYLSQVVKDFDAGQLTPHDLSLMEPQIRKVELAYRTQTGSSIDGFDKIMATFAPSS